MRCQVCRGKAAVEVRQHGAAYCPGCFTEYFLKQVRRNIEDQGMLSTSDRLLVAVSGGKDSLSLWDALLQLGYHAAGLYLDLGIPGYSARSRERCEAFAKERQAALQVVSVEQELGLGVPDLARRTRRAPCAVCGRVKRYLFNRSAQRGGFDVVATGHNLDDEAAALLGNLLHWQTGYLARQQPHLPSVHPGLIRKVKPLYTITERECLAYALIRGLPFHDETCPHARGVSTITYKEALNHIEGASPGTKLAFFKGFLKHRDFFRSEQGPQLRECSRCGQVTTEEVCSVCRLIDRAAAASRRPRCSPATGGESQEGEQQETPQAQPDDPVS